VLRDLRPAPRAVTASRAVEADGDDCRGNCLD